jgi:hypothetical protein
MVSLCDPENRVKPAISQLAKEKLTMRRDNVSILIDVDGVGHSSPPGPGGKGIGVKRYLLLVAERISDILEEKTYKTHEKREDFLEEIVGRT